MAASQRISAASRLIALAAATTLVAGCAGTPQHASAQTASPAGSATDSTFTASTSGTPASGSRLVRTADFTAKAEREGWNPSVRDGQVVYCKEYMPMNSMIPRKTCLSKSAVKTAMLAEERQRENMQRAGAAACPSGSSCQ